MQHCPAQVRAHRCLPLVVLWHRLCSSALRHCPDILCPDYSPYVYEPSPVYKQFHVRKSSVNIKLFMGKHLLCATFRSLSKIMLCCFSVCFLFYWLSFKKEPVWRQWEMPWGGKSHQARTSRVCIQNTTSEAGRYVRSVLLANRSDCSTPTISTTATMWKKRQLANWQQNASLHAYLTWPRFSTRVNHSASPGMWHVHVHRVPKNAHIFIF